MNSSISSNPVFFLLLKAIAELLAGVCNHAKKCVGTRVLFMFSALW